MRARKIAFSVLSGITLFAASPLLASGPDAQPGPGVSAEETRLKARNERVHSIANAVLSILQDQKKGFADREETMQNGIIHMVDLDWIARFVLGSSWRTASEEQRERYSKLYGRYLMKMYIANFAQSSERKVRDIKVLGIADSEPETYLARTEVDLSTNEEISVDYLVREKNNTHQIIDIVLEGVSLLHTHRAEFSKMASTIGVDGVIATLEQRIHEDKPALAAATGKKLAQYQMN